eukprot:TRINITY_DN802_c0_g1_i1.p1 TRINITY_DN802_c0_g1~~TRINITY_DN802_c0_g1_i1.p1  ORF type:complete len:601 (+),score=74.09 TRINITY_DN802_c0_g1_i1:69-1871(+)
MPYLIDVFAHYDSFKYNPLPLCGPLHELMYGCENPAKDGVFTVIPKGRSLPPTQTGHSVSKKSDFLDKFKKFTFGILENINWENVLVIGGSVVSSLLGSEEGFESSDVDIYIYGILREYEFRNKVQEIIDAVTMVNGVEIPHTVVRTPFTVTVGFGYPVRHIQIITAPWQSAKHILSTCDIEPTAVGYNGHTVLATPRARFSYNRRCIVANERSVTVRGRTHYPLRMAKYASRGFSVVDPDMSEDTFRKKLPEFGWVPKLATHPSAINELTAPGDVTYRGKAIDLTNVNRGAYRLYIKGSRGFIDINKVTLEKPPVLNADPDQGQVYIRLYGSDLAVHCGRVAMKKLMMLKKSFLVAFCLQKYLPSDLVNVTLQCIDPVPGMKYPPVADSFSVYNLVYKSSSMPYRKDIGLDSIVSWAHNKELESRRRSLVTPYGRCPGKYEIIESDYVHLTSFEPLVDPYKGDKYRCSSTEATPPSIGSCSTFSTRYQRLLALDKEVEDKYDPAIKSEMETKKRSIDDTRQRIRLFNSYSTYLYDYDLDGSDIIASYPKECKKRGGISPRPRLWWRRVNPRKKPTRVADKARARDRSLKRKLCDSPTSL